VVAFLDGRIRFDQIHLVNSKTLENVLPGPEVNATLESLLELDARTRRTASGLIKELAS
jgi:1-deoxy-D-xylulose-5-phosphate reductoisomerase